MLFWNVYCENLNAPRVADCLEHFSPDVAVLCEATQDHVEAASSYGHHIASARDYLQSGVMCYLAITAKIPISQVAIVRHAEDDKPPASWLAKRMGWVEFLDTLGVVISELRLPIVCLHLSAGCGPVRRRRELEAATAQIPDYGPCIVAGDFNSFAEPWCAPFLAGPLGYRWSDWVRRERNSNDHWFAKRGFVPTVDAVTFPRFRLRMDQVYVRGLEIITATVSRNCFGSDHRPIIVDLALPKPQQAASTGSLRASESTLRRNNGFQELRTPG